MTRPRKPRTTKPPPPLTGFPELIEIHGGLHRLTVKDYILATVPGGADLVIESLGRSEYDPARTVVTTSLYYTEGGESKKDPDIMWTVPTATWRDGVWTPVYIDHDGSGRFVAAQWEEGGELVTDPAKTTNILAFARTWDQLIREQGYIDAYRAKRGKGLVIAGDPGKAAAPRRAGGPGKPKGEAANPHGLKIVG